VGERKSLARGRAALRRERSLSPTVKPRKGCIKNIQIVSLSIRSFVSPVVCRLEQKSSGAVTLVAVFGVGLLVAVAITASLVFKVRSLKSRLRDADATGVDQGKGPQLYQMSDVQANTVSGSAVAVAAAVAESNYVELAVNQFDNTENEYAGLSVN